MRFIAFLCWVLALGAQPAFAASSPQLQSLERQLAWLSAGKSSDVGIAALDLRTGELVSVRGDEPFPMARRSRLRSPPIIWPRSRTAAARSTTGSGGAPRTGSWKR